METKIKRLDLNLVFLLVDYIKMVGVIGFELVSQGCIMALQICIYQYFINLTISIL